MGVREFHELIAAASRLPDGLGAAGRHGGVLPGAQEQYGQPAPRGRAGAAHARVIRPGEQGPGEIAYLQNREARHMEARAQVVGEDAERGVEGAVRDDAAHGLGIALRQRAEGRGRAHAHAVDPHPPRAEDVSRVLRPGDGVAPLLRAEGDEPPAARAAAAHIRGQHRIPARDVPLGDPGEVVLEAGAVAVEQHDRVRALRAAVEPRAQPRAVEALHVHILMRHGAQLRDVPAHGREVFREARVRYVVRHYVRRAARQQLAEERDERAEEDYEREREHS